MFLQHPLPKCIGQYVKSKYSSILIRGQAATWERILQTLEISTLIGGFTQVGQTRSSGANTLVTTFPQIIPYFSYQISQNSSLSPENYFRQWKSVVFFLQLGLLQYISPTFSFRGQFSPFLGNYVTFPIFNYGCIKENWKWLWCPHHKF